MIIKNRILPALLMFAVMLTMVVPVAAQSVNPTSANVLVDGKAVSFEAYTIDGSNYFKLRDLAMVLNGTNKQFSVGWDGAANAITLTSGQPYAAVGGELAQGDGKAKTATPATAAIYLNGGKLDLTAYTIGGNNFFKLRDVMSALDVGVTWDNATSTIGIDSSIGYATTPTEESAANTIDDLPELPEGAQGWAKALKDISIDNDKSNISANIKAGDVLPYYYYRTSRGDVFTIMLTNGKHYPVNPADWEILS